MRDRTDQLKSSIDFTFGVKIVNPELQVHLREPEQPIDWAYIFIIGALIVIAIGSLQAASASPVLYSITAMATFCASFFVVLFDKG